jgi:hypothetical protein
MTTLLQEFEEWLKAHKPTDYGMTIEITLEAALKKLEELKKKHHIG